MISKKQGKEKPQQLVARLAQKEELQTFDVQQIQNAAIHHYGDAWAQVFVRWIVKAEQQHSQTLEKIQQSKQEIKDKVESEVRDETEKLIQFQKSENQTLKEKLSYLQEREVKREIREAVANQRRQRFDARKRLPLRDAASWNEVDHALRVIEQKKYLQEFARSRDRVTILILYFTGLRITNLLHCDVNNLHALLNRGVFSLPAIKTRYNREIRIPVTKAMQRLALQNREHIERLCHGKEGTDKVMTTKNSLQTISRSLFDRRINKILKEASKTTRKNLTSHSFRIGQVTHMIRIAGLAKAQQLIGHRDIKTTILYDRGDVSEKEREQIYKQLDTAKLQSVPRSRKSKINTQQIHPK